MTNNMNIKNNFVISRMILTGDSSIMANETYLQPSVAG